MIENEDFSSTAEADLLEDDQKANHGARRLKRYVCVHAAVVACASIGAVMDTYMQIDGVACGMIYSVVFCIINITGVFVPILPVFSIAILLASRRKGREYAYWGIVDIMLCVLHVIALVPLMQ